MGHYKCYDSSQTEAEAELIHGVKDRITNGTIITQCDETKMKWPSKDKATPVLSCASFPTRAAESTQLLQLHSSLRALFSTLSRWSQSRRHCMTITMVNATLSIFATHLRWLCRGVSKPVRITPELFSQLAPTLAIRRKKKRC